MILVTGATGHVGQEIVKQLTHAGYRVRILARAGHKTDKLQRLYGCEAAIGDVLRPNTITNALSGITAVIHLVGIIVETPDSSFENIHVQGTAHVITAMQQAGIKRYLHMSALGTRPSAVARYHQTKWAAEELVRKSHLDWTIFRPSLIYGPSDHLINQFRAMLRFPLNLLQLYTLPNLGGGHNSIQPVRTEEVAHCFVRALAHEKSVGQTYDLCGPQPLLFRELLITLLEEEKKTFVPDPYLLRVTGRAVLWASTFILPGIFVASFFCGCGGVLGKTMIALLWFGAIFLSWHWKSILLITIPWPLAKCMAWLMETFLPRPLLTRDQLIMLQEDNVGCPEKAQAEFCFTAMPFRLGLRKILGK